MIRKDSGKVIFDGKEIQDGDYEYKRYIVLFWNADLLWKIISQRILEFAGSMYDIEKEEVKRRTAELIEFFDLTEKQNEWIEK